MSAFDPAAHRMVPEQRWFDDFRLGERFVLPSRTMTDAVFLAFQAASGDNPNLPRFYELGLRSALPKAIWPALNTAVLRSRRRPKRREPKHQWRRR